MFRFYPFIQRSAYFLLFLVLFFYCLIVARNFLYPICLAILFAYLVYPLARFLEKHGIPRIVANLICIIIMIAFLSELIIILSNQLSVFVEDFPLLRAKALKNIDELALGIEERFGISAARQKVWMRDRLEDLFVVSGEFFRTAFNATTGTLVALGLLPVYIFFILYYRNKFKEFILRIAPDRIHNKTNRILDEVSYVTKRYMTGILIVVVILCFFNSLGLMIVGVNYPVLLGIISAFFNFIPYFGTLIGGSIPFFVALLTMDSPSYALGVIILFLIVQFTENNILTPNITGGNVRLNPLITILSIIVGGMVWGIPGMFLSVPFLAMFKIVCDHVEVLSPLGFILGTEGTEQHAITFDKIKRLFKKKKKKV